jgi:hypothetical protein
MEADQDGAAPEEQDQTVVKTILHTHGAVVKAMVEATVQKRSRIETFGVRVFILAILTLFQKIRGTDETFPSNVMNTGFIQACFNSVTILGNKGGDPKRASYKPNSKSEHKRGAACEGLKEALQSAQKTVVEAMKTAHVKIESRTCFTHTLNSAAQRYRTTLKNNLFMRV